MNEDNNGYIVGGYDPEPTIEAWESKRKMSSLREEIANHIKTILVDQDCNWAAEFDINKYANSILKLIEKRIDSRIAYYNSGGIVEVSNNIEIIEELELIKKEMLK